MNTFVRYKIELGDNTDFSLNTSLFWDDPNTSELIGEYNISVVEVTPGETLNLLDVPLLVPQDAAQMVKIEPASLKGVIVFFIKSDNRLVNNAFAYQIIRENWIELTFDDSE